MHTDLLKHLSYSDLTQMMILSHGSLSCRTEDQLTKLVQKFKTLFPFENALFAQAKVPDAFIDPDVEVTTLNVSYPGEYMSCYFENEYHQTDAVLCNFFLNLSPVSWLKVDRKRNYDYPAAILANDFNMIDGWTYGTLDLDTMSCVTLSVGGPDEDGSIRSYKILEYLMPFFSEAFKKVYGPIANQEYSLTPREIEVLNWIKEGKSSWDISVILNCSKRVVDFHVNNLKKKLNAVSRAQAVAISMSQGIIDL